MDGFTDAGTVTVNVFVDVPMTVEPDSVSSVAVAVADTADVSVFSHVFRMVNDADFEPAPAVTVTTGADPQESLSLYVYEELGESHDAVPPLPIATEDVTEDSVAALACQMAYRVTPTLAEYVPPEA